MKALSSIMKKALTVLLVLVLSFATLACDDNKNSSTPGGDSSINSSSSSTAPAKPAVTIAIESEKDSISVGEEVKLTVVVENAEDPSYTWSVSEDDLKIVQIADDVLSIKEGADIKFDTNVVLTATSNEDPSAKATKTIMVIAPVVEGRVGELTSEMIAEIGNPSITVTGTLEDVYFDNRNSYLSSTDTYAMSVEMEEGKWKSSWHIVSSNVEYEASVISTSYSKGEQDGIKDQNGNVGHPLVKTYINKNNEVATSIVKDYLSVPAIWESQHLWNHLANLNVNKFVYDEESNLYLYKVESNDETSLYLMTYLAYSLTPLLTDTLVEIGLTVENGAITSLIGKTERVYYGLDEQSGDFDAYIDTIIKLEFSNVGSTVVSDPAPYEAPEYAEQFNAALQEMQNAKNYTFKTVDKQMSAPSGNEGDYDIMSVSANTGATTYGVNTAPSASGVVGTVGFVTEEKILFHETGKYSYSMDDKLYYFNYSGYVQNSDETYDYFESDGGLLVGKRKYAGSMFDAMPTFDFSANVFEFDGIETVKINGANVSCFKFVLRESSITREVAMELCTEGKDAGELANAELIVWVTNIQNNYHVCKVQVPYDLVSGTYTGTYTTTFESLGSTVINEAYFEDYVPRVIPTTWAETITKYYQENFTGNSHEENTLTVMDATYGDIAKDIPSPAVLFEIFGDSMSGPFYDWKVVSTDENGNELKRGWIGINLSAQEEYLDENSRIIDFEAYAAHIDAVFTKYGYTKSPANSDISGGESGQSTLWLTYTKGDIMVVIENIHTKWFYVDFYKLGDWTLNR